MKRILLSLVLGLLLTGFSADANAPALSDRAHRENSERMGRNNTYIATYSADGDVEMISTTSCEG